MYADILVPTDGSDHAERAAEHAGWLADRFGATVHLLAAVDIQAAAGPFGAGGVDARFVEQLESGAEAALDAVETAAGDVPTTRETVREAPSGAILEHAESTGVDLVVMGTHGRTGARRLVAGSVTENVVRQAAAPVLVVHAVDPPLAERYEDVVLTSDGSEPAGVAVDHGLSLAERDGARVHALSVVNLGGMARAAEDAEVLEWRSYLERAAEETTDTVAERARSAGLEAVAAVRGGSPVDALVEYADETGADLLVVGTHGRRGVDRLLLGSTTERLVRRAGVPVLTVRRGADGERTVGGPE
jgi:nucleotide-binding universal stress UspA family protein